MQVLQSTKKFPNKVDFKKGLAFSEITWTDNSILPHLAVHLFCGLVIDRAVLIIVGDNENEFF